MKPCHFLLNQTPIDRNSSDMPISINLAQVHVKNNSSIIDDISGTIGEGALPYFFDVPDPENTLGAIRTLNKLFSNYKRPGVRRDYLFNLCKIYKLPRDYGSQALSPQFVDFTVSCYNCNGEKINHSYVALLREFHSRDAYVLIDSSIFSGINSTIITIKINYKINSSNNKLVKLEYGDGYFYYDPDEDENIDELSLLTDSSSDYCIYAVKDGTFYTLINSFRFNKIKSTPANTDDLVNPQSGEMIRTKTPNGSSGMYISDIGSESETGAKLYTTENGANVLDILYDDITEDTFKDNTTNVINEDIVKNSLYFQRDNIQDYFRQVYNNRRSDKKESYTRPNYNDKYIITFTPYEGIDTSTYTLYLGTRAVEEQVFFYNSTRFNGKKNIYTNTLSDNKKTESSVYRFNTMYDFEVYEYLTRESPFGKKIAAEDPKLYDTDGKSKWFTGKSVDGNKIYEIVPRYDNNMYYSIAFESPEADIELHMFLNYFSIYNHHSSKSAYLFKNGCLDTNNIFNDCNTPRLLQGLLMYDKESDVYNELCIHIPYSEEEIDTEIFSPYNDVFPLDAYGIDIDELVLGNKFLYRQSYINEKNRVKNIGFTIYDLGLPESNRDELGNINREGYMYVYDKTEPVRYRDSDIYVEDKILKRNTFNGDKHINNINSAYNSNNDTVDDIVDKYTKIYSNFNDSIDNKYFSKDYTIDNILGHEIKYNNICFKAIKDGDPLKQISKDTDTVLAIAFENISDVPFPLYLYGVTTTGDKSELQLLDIIKNCGSSYKFGFISKYENESKCIYYIPIDYNVASGTGIPYNNIDILDKYGNSYKKNNNVVLYGFDNPWEEWGTGDIVNEET